MTICSNKVGRMNIDTPFKILSKCIDSIHYGDDVYQRIDISDKEIEGFIDQLTGEQFTEIMEFFNTMPKLRHIIEVTNPNTKVKSEVVLEGLQNFLGQVFLTIVYLITIKLTLH